MKYSIITLMLGLALFVSFTSSYAAQDIGQGSEIQAILIKVEPSQSRAEIRVRLKPSAGGKLYIIRFTGQNYDSRAAELARSIKNCTQISLSYNPNNRTRIGTTDAFIVDDYFFHVLG